MENLRIITFRSTEQTQLLIAGLQKARSQKVMRDQSNQLKRQAERDALLTSLATTLCDPELTRSLFSPNLHNYSRLFVAQTHQGLCCDQYVLLNGNGICIIGLAETHFLIRQHLTIEQIEYGVSEKIRWLNIVAIK